MTIQRDADTTTSRRLLWTVLLAMVVAAALLWGASALVWAQQRYRTPFSGDITTTATGAMLRPELVPLALVTLAAIAAVLAAGRWLRRVIGLLVGVTGVLLCWRSLTWYLARPFVDNGVPPGSTPLGAVSAHAVGPALMAVAGLALLAAGFLVLLRAPRMPGMGARYSAPGAKRTVRDPDKQWWEALDQGEDPTVEPE